MSETYIVTCDSCGYDLTKSGNCVDYRLALLNQSVPSIGGFVTAMGAYPAIERDVHFCGIDCLRDWLDRNYPADKGPHHDGKIGSHWRKRQGEAAKEKS